MSFEEELCSLLTAKFPKIDATVKRAKRVVVEAPASLLRDVAKTLRDEFAFDHPVSAGAVDRIDRGVFEMLYFIWSTKNKVLVILKTEIKRDEPVLDSLTEIWEGLEWHERESWEMFGIEFRGHPKLERLLLPENWRGVPPLRKDFSPEAH